MMGGMGHMMMHGMNHMYHHYHPMGAMGMHGMHHPGGLMTQMAQMGHMSPMFNTNMGYMMGRAVKKCQPLKNGLEICAMYNPMTNQLNVDVKCKNCKKLKKNKKRLFPKQLSKMIKMLVKERVFGHTGQDLLSGGKLESRFGKHVGLHDQASPAKKPKGAKAAKGAKSANAEKPKKAA